MRIILPCIGFFLFALSAQAQKSTLAFARTPDTAVISLFDHSTVLLWQRYYRGTLNDVHAIEFSLASDGQSCRGYLRYPKSRTRVRLHGSLRDDKLNLIEYTADNAPCGYWTGTIRHDVLMADWSNVAQNLGAYAEARVSPYPLVANNITDETPNFTRYEGKSNGGGVEMILLQAYGNQLVGSLRWAGDATAYRLKGRLESDSLLSLQVVSADMRQAVRIDGVFKAKAPLHLRWSTQGERRDLDLKPAGSFPAAADAWADFQVIRDVTYPRTDCGDCNRWFEKKIGGWRKLAPEGQVQKASERHKVQAAGWVDLACWSERVMSGYLFLSGPQDSLASGWGFSVNLHERTLMEIDDIFEVNAAWKDFLNSFAKKQSGTWARMKTDPAFKQWIDQTGFPLQTINNKGLELSTPFHPVFGRHAVQVPADMLKPYVNKKKALKGVWTSS
ncbi:MAG: hypothetical protein ACOYNO_04050 [Saprospiraceae bacterium]